MHQDCEARFGAAAEAAAMFDGLSGYVWTRNNIGESGGEVYRLHGNPGAPDLYLKYCWGAEAGSLLDEVSRLRWLAAHLRVPALVEFRCSADEAWLLMEALPGETAYQALLARPEEREVVVDALARFLKKLHSIPINQCPFNSGQAYRLGLARQRLDAGLVDEDDFDEERRGWSASHVWREMLLLLPQAPDLVVTHGDFSLDNILVVGNEVAGCIDVGRAGSADRYQDLAILWNCLGEFDTSLRERLFASYGMPVPDWSKLQFHLMLDEFF
ncbi:aminoglycoside 3'-phosphotransferase-1 [Rhodovulum visakhapatnamense]|uniref:Aminoglycoside 3'-phosphotransferase n=2 Tax=Rhodovulum visakhapatnamense TaxID=364297 RepID=A0A4R8G1F3_9RHOB|nr:aminoglycoside 3'-phosphotransferase-1 [Rhodovulum visakhapatnamense]